MRFHFPVASIAAFLLLVPAGAWPQGASRYDVEDVALSQLAADLAAGKTTSAEITQAYVDRIRTYDSALHAVIRVAPDAMQQALASDQRRRIGKAIGPLDGIPILVKDNIDARGMPTTAGSFALLENRPLRDSEVVRRLRDAGAVILGKTNLSQWSSLRTSDAFAGSTVGGATHNPYDLRRSAGESSDGAGIAVAASFAAAAVATDTTASIMSPASIMGLVGMTPSTALVSRRGIVPVSRSLDAVGPMTRTVTDMAMLLQVMAGSDPADAMTAEADARKGDYVKALSADALKGKKVGVIRRSGGYTEASKPVFEAALMLLQREGAELVDLPPDLLEDLGNEHRTVMLYEMKQDLAAYLAHAPAAVKVRTLADIIAFNKADPRERLHAQDHLEAAEATIGGRDSPQFRKVWSHAQRRAGPDGYGRAFAQYGVSVVVGVSRGAAMPAPPDGTPNGGLALEMPKGSRPGSISGNASFAGLPNLTVPLGSVAGMPIGMSFVAPRWSEAALLAYAFDFEQASQVRRPPTAYKDAVHGRQAAGAATQR